MVIRKKPLGTQKSLTISVVIGAYNEEKYLPFALQSLNEQKRRADEIIVVDNNSTDKTSEIARTYNTRVLKERRQGYVYSVNKGLMSAKHDIIAVTDADTVVPRDWLMEIEKAFHDRDVVGVATPMDTFDSRFYSKLISYVYNPFVKMHYKLNLPFMAGMSMAVRRDVLHLLGGYDLRYKTGADVELGVRLRKHGKIQFLSHVIVKTSSRRFKKSPVNSSIKHSKSYVYAMWIKKPNQDSLQPFR